MSSLQSSRASRYVRPLDGGLKVLERPMVFYGSRVDGAGDAAVRWLDSFFVRRLCGSRLRGSQGFDRF